MSAAQTVMARCDELATFTEEPGAITRRFATDAMRRAQEKVGEWMRLAGMEIRRDNVGNLRGRYGGGGDLTLLVGSHLDSVRDAGKYDGPLGVLVAIAAVQRLHDAERRLPFAIEVLAFADEEGLRFGSTYLGSRAVAGKFDQRDLELTDADGVTMAEAIREFGGDPGAIAGDRLQGALLGYCEVHIEQGPVLEARGLPVGVVSAIAGQDRLRIRFTGVAGHAGTVPMDRRHDPLVVAAMFMIAVEQEAKLEEGMVATVGQVEVRPGASNVIPGQVELSLDVRHADDEKRLHGTQRMLSDAHALAEGRGVAVEVVHVSENAATACSPRLVALLSQAAGPHTPLLTSGAGHDAAAMSALTDVGMLFVRCKGGISHNPAEDVTEEDVGVAIDVLDRFLELLAGP